MSTLDDRAKVIANVETPLLGIIPVIGTPTVTIIPAQPAEPARRTRGPNKPKVVAERKVA